MWVYCKGTLFISPCVLPKSLSTLYLSNLPCHTEEKGKAPPCPEKCPCSSSEKPRAQEWHLVLVIYQSEISHKKAPTRMARLLGIFFFPWILQNAMLMRRVLAYLILELKRELGKGKSSSICNPWDFSVHLLPAMWWPLLELTCVSCWVSELQSSPKSFRIWITNTCIYVISQEKVTLKQK